MIPKILLTMTIFAIGSIKSTIAQSADYQDETHNRIDYPLNSAEDTDEIEPTTTNTPEKICIDVNDSVTSAEFSDASGSIFHIHSLSDIQRSNLLSSKSKKNRCVNDS